MSYKKAGLAQGAAQGLGGFSGALMNVLQSMQGRERYQDETDYRAGRDTATDQYRQDALAQQGSYQDESLALRREESEAQRAARLRAEQTDQSRYADDLRMKGVEPIDAGQMIGATSMTGGSFGKAMMDELKQRGEYVPNFQAGEYNPEGDVGLRREQAGLDAQTAAQRELIQARGAEDRQTLRERSSVPTGPSEFTFSGGKFPMTEEGIAEAREFEQQLSGEDPERRDMLIQGAIARLKDPRTGEVDNSERRVEEVLNELRARGASPQDLQMVAEYFGIGRR